LTGWFDSFRDAWHRLSGDDAPDKVLIAPYGKPSSVVDPRQLEGALRQVELLRNTGRLLTGATLLEIGTGSQPILPLVYYLAGVDDIIVVDQTRVVDRDLLMRTAANMRAYSGELAERLDLTEREVSQRLAVPEDSTIFGALRHFKIQYLAPCNLLDTPFLDGSMHVVGGRDLLGVYQPAYLRRLLPRVGALLRPGGIMALCLARGDRLSYLRLLRDAGFRITVDETDPVLRVVEGNDPPPEDPRLLDTCIISTWKDDSREAIGS
jgi:hypothetical protein